MARGKKAKKLASSSTTPKESASEDGTPVTPATPTEDTSSSVLAGISVTGVLMSKPTAKDVKIGGFSLSLHGKELFQDTLIEFTIGRRYGLIGSNGSGKSTFLKVLAAREVPIPENIDIYLLEQEYPPSELTAIEAVLEKVKKEIERLDELQAKLIEEDGPECEALETIFSRLEELEIPDAEARAGMLLHGLGFSKEMMSKKTKDLSGGWRMRVSLAQALFVKPTLLLLDEPTNHLDLEACVWLEDYLSTYEYCMVVVSHSQDFLNGVCTHIMHLTEKKGLTTYTGNYDSFIRTKQENEINQQKQYEKEQADIKHMKEFIASCGTFSNLVRQAKSRQKLIDKMVDNGLTEKVIRSQRWSFKFPDCEKLPPPVLAFTDVSFSYSGKLDEHTLYEHLDLGVDCDSRIALVGPNGAGKSTLLKLMVGELIPLDGTIRRHTHIRMERYWQHSNDILPLDISPLEFMMQTFPEKGSDIEKWRSVIGRFGITGQQQVQPIGILSDGLKSRVIFALMATRNPNILLLDEPTNHLDMECIDSLAEAINEYNGGVVLVSHDFRLIDQVAEEIWICDNKTVTKWKGSIREYKQSLVDKMVSEGYSFKARFGKH